MIRRIWTRLQEWLSRNELALGIGALLLLLLLVYLRPFIVVSILPGQSGVLWSRFFGGTQTDRMYQEGLRVKFPWDQMYKYNIRLQQRNSTFEVLSADGLHISVDITARFRIIESGLATLHKNVGPDYVETLVLPEVSSLARQEISQLELQEFYTEQREQIQRRILDTLREGIKVGYNPGSEPVAAIHVEDVLIRRMTLPPRIREAIEDKLDQEQMALEYDYRLLREEKERDRKRIEAEGIRLFQDIVSEGISERYLKWKGIDATLALAASQNSKIVVIGAGEDGLPIILGGLDSSTAPASDTAGSALLPSNIPADPNSELVPPLNPNNPLLTPPPIQE